MDKISWGPKANEDYFRPRFEEFLESGTLEDACRDKKGRLKHIVSAEHFDLEFLATIRDTANAARRISKIEPNYLKQILRHVSVLNYFHQPSTRTFLSFSRAESKLGMQREDVRDLKTSSAAKGESDLDALRTQSSFYEGMVIRHPSNYFAQFAVWAMEHSKRPLKTISAGAGTKEHPTQAILDYYTSIESLGSLDKAVVAFYGDCKRGRTVHSLSRLLALHENVMIYFVAPEELQIDEETEKYLISRNVRVEKYVRGIGSIPQLANINYVTRLQKEYGSDDEVYPKKYIFNKSHLDMMRKDSILMHPFPKKEEIVPQLGTSNDNRIMWWRQQRNGMWTRLATLAYLFNVDDNIRDKWYKIKPKIDKLSSLTTQ